MKPSVLVSTVVCGLLALPAVASAQDQPWLKDRRYTEGIGYRVGDFELHPGAAAEFGYDSNYFHRATNELGGPVGALRLRITPSLSVSTLGAQRREAAPGSSPPSVEFRGGLSLTYNEFFPTNGGDPNSNDRSTMSNQRNLNGALDLDLRILPGRPWGGELTAGVTRAITASEQGTLGQSFNRDLPHAGAELIWTPGAGLFEWRLGYQFGATLFESSTFNNLSVINNTVVTRGRWRFLPRTAFIYDGRFGINIYPNPKSGDDEKHGSHPVRAQLGVNGLITSSFSLLAMVGWGASFYTGTNNANLQNFDSVIGQLELKWFITPTQSSDPAVAASTTTSAVSVGFSRDFVDSFIGTYFERDRGYAGLNYLFGGKFLLVVEGGAGPIIYPKLPAASGGVGPFTDIRIDASIFGEYRFKDSFGVNATVRYNENINHTPVTPNGVMDDLSYRDIEAYLGFRWLM